MYARVGVLFVSTFVFVFGFVFCFVVFFISPSPLCPHAFAIAVVTSPSRPHTFTTSRPHAPTPRRPHARPHTLIDTPSSPLCPHPYIALTRISSLSRPHFCHASYLALTPDQIRIHDLFTRPGPCPHTGPRPLPGPCPRPIPTPMPVSMPRHTPACRSSPTPRVHAQAQTIIITYIKN